MSLLIFAIIYLAIGIISGMILDGLAEEEHPGAIMVWGVFWLPVCITLLLSKLYNLGERNRERSNESD